MLGAAAPDKHALTAVDHEQLTVLTASAHGGTKKKKYKNKYEGVKPLKYGERDSLQASVVFMAGGKRALACFDTMAQCGICDERNIPEDATVLVRDDGTTVEGLGGKISKAGTLYSVKMSMRLGTKPVTFKFRSAALSTPGMQFLWDLQQIK